AAAASATATTGATAARLLCFLRFLRLLLRLRFLRLLWLLALRLGRAGNRCFLFCVVFGPLLRLSLDLRGRLGRDFFLGLDHIQRRRRRSDVIVGFGKQLHLALLDGILGAIHVKNILALIAIGTLGHDRLGTLLIAMRRALIPARLVATTPAAALISLIAPLIAMIAALVAPIAALALLLGRLGGRGRKRRRHTQFFQENQTVARVEQFEVHRVHAKVCIGADDNALGGVLLQIGQRGALFVLKIKTDLRTNRQFDARDAL